MDNVSIEGALGLLINITDGDDIALNEVENAANIIQEAVGDKANIIVGAVIDADFREGIRVTVIATGFNKESHKPKIPLTRRKMDFIHSTIDYLDVPTFQRNEEGAFDAEPDESESDTTIKRINTGGNGHDPEFEYEEEVHEEFKPDDYDFPTVLRRRNEI